MWVKCANPNCNAEYQMDKKGILRVRAKTFRISNTKM